jgi:hypothetical protein
MNRELTKDVVIFSDSSMSGYNAAGMPFLNNRKISTIDENGKITTDNVGLPIYFIQVADYETNCVQLIYQGTPVKTYTIPYNTPVQAFLESKNAPTGKYTVRETNNYDVNEYEAVYVRSGDNKTVIVAERVLGTSQTTHGLTRYDNDPINANNFVIKSAVNELDPYGILKITKIGGKTTIYQLDEVSDIIIDTAGNYAITAVDRLGNEYTIYVNIYTANKIYSLTLENNGVQMLKENMYGGKTITLLTPTNADSQFEFGGWRDENGNIYHEEYTFNTPNNVVLTAVWLYKQTIITVYDGAQIAKITGKTGTLQE